MTVKPIFAIFMLLLIRARSWERPLLPGSARFQRAGTLTLVGELDGIRLLRPAEARWKRALPGLGNSSLVKRQLKPPVRSGPGVLRVVDDNFKLSVTFFTRLCETRTDRTVPPPRTSGGV